MAGDIGHVFSTTYEQFLTKMCHMFTRVFIITGNHEYYYHHGRYISDTDRWMATVEAKIRDIATRLTNLVYLQNELFELPETDICIYGTTLWSRITDRERSVVRQQIADYQRIPNMTTDRSTQLFETNVAHLTETLQNKRLIVISHHLPKYDLIADKYRSSGINSAFASTVEIADDPRIVAWIAGHTHSPMIQGKYYVNPIGYPMENQVTDFNKVISIQLK